MVSMNPTNPGHGFYLPGLSDTNNNNKGWSEGESETAALEEGGSKKVRKAYTITKSRESWTDQEHDKFLEALHLFDRDWKKIEAFVGSKTVIQIRSHAQKYFLKVQKSGTNEHVPPPRPKRKAAHPYPQKAPKIAAVVPHVAAPFQSSASLEHGYIYQPDSSTAFANPVNDSSFSSWTFNSAPPVNVTPVIHDDAVFVIPAVAHNCCSSSSTETPSRTRQTANVLDHGDHGRPCRDAVMPDFAQVYGFLGSLFDPNSSNHLERLKQMAPINMETVLLLMRNLSINLSSSEFENHRTLLASYEGNVETKSSSHRSNLVAFSPGSLIPATG